MLIVRHYLLAGSGVNAENIQSELQSIKFNEYHEPTETTTFEIDIDVSITRFIGPTI